MQTNILKSLPAPLTTPNRVTQSLLGVVRTVEVRRMLPAVITNTTCSGEIHHPLTHLGKSGDQNVDICLNSLNGSKAVQV